jgi:hypothetical protein
MIVVVGLIVSCQVEYPEPPELISPQDGAVFDILPPTFIWSRENSLDNYVIRIAKDNFLTGEIIVDDTLEDTIYHMSENDFEIALNADYFWSVAPLDAQGGVTWREFRKLTLNKPIPELNLDTTYFPFGLNYNWSYETYTLHEEWTWPYPDTTYDTIAWEVVDSLLLGNEWRFILQNDESFLDTVFIRGSKIFIFGEWLPLKPVTGNYGSGIKVGYRKDTLYVTSHTAGSYMWDETLTAYWECDQSYSRIKGIGLIYEDSYYHEVFGQNGSTWTYWKSSLLYFCKGTDTVWRRNQ